MDLLYASYVTIETEKEAKKDLDFFSRLEVFFIGGHYLSERFKAHLESWS